MGGNSGLVIGGAAAKQPPIALGGFKRARHPQIHRPGWLDIVMGVEQNRGRPGRARCLPENGWMCAAHFQQPDILKA